MSVNKHHEKMIRRKLCKAIRISWTAYTRRTYLLVLQESELRVGLFPVPKHIFEFPSVFKTFVSYAFDKALFFFSVKHRPTSR